MTKKKEYYHMLNLCILLIAASCGNVKDEDSLNINYIANNSMNNQEILRELKQGIKETFNDIKSDGQQIISFGILTDPRTAIGFTICYNTIDNLEQRTKAYKLEGFSDTSFIMWDLNEWHIGVSSDRCQFLDQWLIQNAAKLARILTREEYEDYANSILDLMVTALLELRTEGVFSEIKNKDFFLYLSYHEPPCAKEDFNRLKLLLDEEKFLLCKKSFLDEL